MSYIFTLIAPALITAMIVMLIERHTPRLNFLNQRGLLLLGIAVALLSVIPAGRLSLAQFILSFNPVFSIGTLAGAGMFMRHLSGCDPILSRLETSAFVYLSLTLSVLLQASYLGFISPDIYKMGYGYSIWFVLIGALTVAMFRAHSRLAFIPFAALAAFNLRLLPSDNLFDYLVDVPLLAGCLIYLALRGRSRLTPNSWKH